MNRDNRIHGHDEIIARMQRAVTSGKVGHAYILEGEKGMGKKTLANAFAKALQCEAGTPLSGDCTCLSCRVFDSGNHPDITYVTAEKKKSIGVDEVREQLIRPMNIKPFRYRYKIYIIDEAETLTPAAQNALLKTIEEPAAYGVCLLLATRAHALLPTVLSRCVTYRLKPLSDALVLQKLTGEGIPEETARYAATFARGNIGYAMDMATSADFIAMRELAREVTRDIGQTDLIGTFALYRRFEKWKESIQPLLDMLYLCYRDSMVEIATGAARDKQSLRSLFQGVDAITQTKRILRQNGNFQMAVEGLLLRLSGVQV